jgi:hypothetical protein
VNPRKIGLKASSHVKFEAKDPPKMATTGPMQQSEAASDAIIPETDRVSDFFIGVKVRKNKRLWGIDSRAKDDTIS